MARIPSPPDWLVAHHAIQAARAGNEQALPVEPAAGNEAAGAGAGGSEVRHHEGDASPAPAAPTGEQPEPEAPEAEPAPTRNRAGQFLPGMSGNPNGRKPGTVLKRTELKRMMDDGGEAIVRVVIAKAQAGDLDAAQLVLARISPPARPQGEHVNFRFDLHAPLMEQAQQVVAAVANGELTVEAGHMLIQCLSNAAGLKAVDQLAARLEALEGKGRTGALGASMVLDATLLPLPGNTTQQ